MHTPKSIPLPFTCFTRPSNSTDTAKSNTPLTSEPLSAHTVRHSNYFYHKNDDLLKGGLIEKLLKLDDTQKIQLVKVFSHILVGLRDVFHGGNSGITINITEVGIKNIFLYLFGIALENKEVRLILSLCVHKDEHWRANNQYPRQLEYLLRFNLNCSVTEEDLRQISIKINRSCFRSLFYPPDNIYNPDSQDGVNIFILLTGQNFTYLSLNGLHGVESYLANYVRQYSVRLCNN